MEEEECSFYIAFACNNMVPIASGLIINPTSLCLTIITSSIDRCRLCVVVVSRPAVASKTGAKRGIGPYRGSYLHAHLCASFVSTYKCSGIYRLIVV